MPADPDATSARRAPDFQQVKPDPSERIGPWLSASTLWGVGTVKWAPGTWGSLATLLFACALWWGGRRMGFFFGEWTTFAALAAVASLITLRAGAQAEARWGKDPSRVVSDEAAGMALTLALLPPTGGEDDLLRIVIAFVLFRAFDIVKPLGIRAIQKFRGGLGILLDDLAAALAAGGTGILLLHLLG